MKALFFKGVILFAKFHDPQTTHLGRKVMFTPKYVIVIVGGIFSSSENNSRVFNTI